MSLAVRSRGEKARLANGAKWSSVHPRGEVNKLFVSSKDKIRRKAFENLAREPYQESMFGGEKEKMSPGYINRVFHDTFDTYISLEGRKFFSEEYWKVDHQLPSEKFRETQSRTRPLFNAQEEQELKTIGASRGVKQQRVDETG